ncbi:MAG: RluA family pseudouridine synthase [Pirellulales bacterium]|nr:RluA family pseudouridine synthase [Pirellulales bacterium]
MSAESPESSPILLTVDGASAGMRLDAYLAKMLSEYSRAHLQEVIRAKGVTVDGKAAKASLRLVVGQHVSLDTPQRRREGPVPEDIPLDVIYEDEHLAAINKPPGMVVHPAKGHWQGTLAGAVQHRFGSLSGVGGPTRPGIVHRLDRDTSGVIVVAKTDRAHMQLAEQFERRTTKKEYFALVAGVPDHDRDIIDRPIGAHPYQREKKAIRADHPTSRAAETFYEVIERFKGFAAVKLLPKTGRTHQLRVHLASIGCPVLCDRLYGGRAKLTEGELTGDATDETELLARQALHARRLEIAHPESGEPLVLEAPLPADIQAAYDAIRNAR